MWEFIAGCVCGGVGFMIVLFLLLFRMSWFLPAQYQRALTPASVSRQRVMKKLQKQRRGNVDRVGGEQYGEEWFNVIAKRLFGIFAEPMRTSKGTDELMAMLNARIAQVSLPSNIAFLSVTEVDVGGVPPVLTNITLAEGKDAGMLVWGGEFVYVGDAHASVMVVGQVGTKAVPDVVSLPVEAGLSDIVIRVPIRLEISNDGDLRVWLAEIPELNFELHSEVGFTVTIADLPHVKQFVRHHALRLAKTFVFPDGKPLLETTITPPALSPFSSVATSNSSSSELRMRRKKSSSSASSEQKDSKKLS